MIKCVRAVPPAAGISVNSIENIDISTFYSTFLSFKLIISEYVFPYFRSHLLILRNTPSS